MQRLCQKLRTALQARVSGAWRYKGTQMNLRGFAFP
jgi:hypothetical protein